MRKLLIGLFFISTLVVYGQKNPNDKVMKKMSMGTTSVYFIKPFNFDILEASPKAVVKGDITALHMPDSAREEATLNVSFFTANAVEKLDSAVFTTSGNFTSTQSQRFFCEPRKKGWESRYSINFPPKIFLNWLANPAGSYVTLYYNGGKAKVSLPKLLIEYGPKVITQIRVETGWKSE